LDLAHVEHPSRVSDRFEADGECSRRDGPADVAWAVGRNGATVGQELAGVVEHDHAVAQQAPPLLRMEGDDVGGVAVRPVSWWALGSVWTHCAPPDLLPLPRWFAWLLAVADTCIDRAAGEY
jgi:hypothetical protein